MTFTHSLGEFGATVLVSGNLRLRTQLDDATFHEAWAEGRAMTMEQAVDYALESVS